MHSTTKLGWTIALAVAALPRSAGAAEEKMLDPGPDSALVVIRTETWQPAPSMKSAFRLVLSAYDAGEEKLLGKPFGGFATLAAQPKKFVGPYLVERIKPGRWVFQSYSQQDRWALCFNAASLQFEVRPGQIVYLGEFDAPFHRVQLTRAAMASGQMRLRGTGFANYFDLGDGPHVRPADPAALAALRAALASAAPDAKTPVVAAEYSPARFGTGSTLFGERVCGGYFTKGAKEMNKGR